MLVHFLKTQSGASARLAGLVLAAGALAITSPLSAQDQYAGQAPAPDSGAPLSGIHQLVAPIALYPDPLLGIMLPAATDPNDLQAAANGGGQGDFAQPVEDLTHYPQVLDWMAQNQQWSDQLGAAFADQPGHVMDAIQDLRRQALASGALHSTDQVQVVQDNGYIQIVPAQPGVVFIPHYDADAVFGPGHVGVAIDFGAALPAGAWLGFYPMWGKHALYSGDWYAYSQGHGGWAGVAKLHGGFFGHFSGVSNAHEWRVASDAQIRKGNFAQAAHVNGNYARPQPMNGANGGNVGFQANRQRNGQAWNANQNRSQFTGDQQQRAIESERSNARDHGQYDQNSQTRNDELQKNDQLQRNDQLQKEQAQSQAEQRQDHSQFTGDQNQSFQRQNPNQPPSNRSDLNGQDQNRRANSDSRSTSQMNGDTGRNSRYDEAIGQGHSSQPQPGVESRSTTSPSRETPASSSKPQSKSHSSSSDYDQGQHSKAQSKANSSQ